MAINEFDTVPDFATAEATATETKMDFRQARFAGEPVRSTGETALKVTQVAVVGLGYVGLPLSLQFARSSDPRASTAIGRA